MVNSAICYRFCLLSMWLIQYVTAKCSLPFASDMVKQFRTENDKIGHLIAHMAENADPHSHFDPNIQSEDIAFKPGDLMSCGRCSRSNPPNRIECLYCGEVLEANLQNVGALKVNLQQLEPWQPGWNVISLLSNTPDELVVKQVASILSLEIADVKALLSATVPMPLARLESEQKAEVLSSQLIGLNVTNCIVGDEALDADKQPVRLRRVDLGDGVVGLHDFNSGSINKVDPAEIALIVIGQLVTSRTDILEKRKRKGTADIIDAMATGSDETVIDIYTRGDPYGYRIRSTGFDFSSLGSQMSLVTPENVRALIERLRAAASTALLVNSYTEVRPLLEATWPTESRNDTIGFHRTGFAKRGFGSIASTSNLLQFTKFSRLQYHIRSK